jgi:molecular chaperone DnaK (HSP70)
MPAVRRMLHEISGKPPDTGVNPVLAVSLGAAIYAHMLESGGSARVIQPQSAVQPDDDRTAYELEVAPPSLPTTAETIPHVRFVTAHGVGVKVHSGGRSRNKVLIPRNTRVPVSVTRQFFTRSTGSGGRRIKIEITQGDTDDLAVAEELGIGRIEALPRGEPEGQPVDVTLQFDQQGRLHIHARYVPTDQRMEMSLEIPGGLKEEEVEAHRHFLETTGFLKPVDARGLLEELERAESLDDEPFDVEPLDVEPLDAGPVDADPVFDADQLFKDLGLDPDDEDDDEGDDLPLIEPVD